MGLEAMHIDQQGDRPFVARELARCLKGHHQLVTYRPQRRRLAFRAHVDRGVVLQVSGDDADVGASFALQRLEEFPVTGSELQRLDEHLHSLLRIADIGLEHSPCGGRRHKLELLRPLADAVGAIVPLLLCALEHQPDSNGEVGAVAPQGLATLGAESCLVFIFPRRWFRRWLPRSRAEQLGSQPSTEPWCAAITSPAHKDG
mmetsp:Transcript_36079/g.99493  ORF Transcript_36079/g.99493 Transcript_36079/m.99493 type:complete len:202 (-) Transcript_36079:352-957(-)